MDLERGPKMLMLKVVEDLDRSCRVRVRGGGGGCQEGGEG
jgi:hypothetical protein